jgi:S1 RNA binding domain protein
MELEVGSILEGKVTGITKFGAFVSLPDNKSGLVHISEIAYSYVNDVHDHLQEGQQVKVKVIGIDDSKRINLSIKKATPPPPRPQNNFDRGDRGERAERSEHAERPDRGNRPERGTFQNNRPSRPAPSAATFNPRPAQPKGPMDFEDQLKQFMSYSDSKLSELHMNDRRSSRRGNNGGGRRS